MLRALFTGMMVLCMMRAYPASASTHPSIGLGPLATIYAVGDNWTYTVTDHYLISDRIQVTGQKTTNSKVTDDASEIVHLQVLSVDISGTATAKLSFTGNVRDLVVGHAPKNSALHGAYTAHLFANGDIKGVPYNQGSSYAVTALFSETSLSVPPHLKQHAQWTKPIHGLYESLDIVSFDKRVSLPPALMSCSYNAAQSLSVSCNFGYDAKVQAQLNGLPAQVHDKNLTAEQYSLDPSTRRLLNQQSTNKDVTTLVAHNGSRTLNITEMITGTSQVIAS